MSTSRRSFIKQAIGSTGVGWQALHPNVKRATDQPVSGPSASISREAEPASSPEAQVFTRGLGVYPGDLREYFGPTLVEDTVTYRNLALHRPAYHSSAYDYNRPRSLSRTESRTHASPIGLRLR